ncbi:MAG: cobalt transporter CbiM [Pseudomonadota bacterium]
MHVPDNYLSPSTCAAAGAVMVPVWAWAVKKVKKEFSSKNIVLVGIFAAYSFLLMMFNIPLPGGTTGHAVGATLLSVLIGPFAACVSLSIALFIQAVFFGDGGLLSFGVNAFNIAFVMTFSGYFIYMVLRSLFRSDKWNSAALFVASYMSLNIGALFTALEFGIQPLLFKNVAGLPMYSPYPLSIALPAMMIPHLLVVGVIEGFITVGIYNFIKRVSPVSVRKIYEVNLKPAYAVIVFMILLSPLGMLVSGTAWGEWDRQNGFKFNSIIPDYAIPFIKNGALSYMLSAVIGVALVLFITRALKRVFNARTNY